VDQVEPAGEGGEEEFRVAPVTGPGSPMRARLEALLREKRWEDALAQLQLMRHLAPDEEEELIARCIGLVEERLARRYEREIGDRGRAALRLAPESDPRWANLRDDARQVVGLVNGVATFDDILEETSLGRFAALRELARLVKAGLVGGVHEAAASVPPLAVASPARRSPSPRWALPVACALSLAGLAISLVLAFGSPGSERATVAGAGAGAGAGAVADPVAVAVAVADPVAVPVPVGVAPAESEPVPVSVGVAPAESEPVPDPAPAPVRSKPARAPASRCRRSRSTASSPRPS
jgi:hypothetical protein